MKTIAKMKRYFPVYLMMLPGLAYLFINNYMPMTGIIAAFKNINFRKGIWGSEWAGLSNFVYLFKTRDAWIITRNTVGYNLAFMILEVIFGILFAVFICEINNQRAKKVYQSAILFPYLMSIREKWP